MFDFLIRLKFKLFINGHMEVNDFVDIQDVGSMINDNILRMSTGLSLAMSIFDAGSMLNSNVISLQRGTNASIRGI